MSIAYLWGPLRSRLRTYGVQARMRETLAPAWTTKEAWDKHEPKQERLQAWCQLRLPDILSSSHTMFGSERFPLRLSEHLTQKILYQYFFS